VIAALAARLDGAPAVLGAHLALYGGALVERGVAAGPLGPAMLAPLTRALAAAARFVELTRALDDDHAAPSTGGLVIGDKRLSAATVDALFRRDGEALQAFESLRVWFRPAAAVWCRDRASLRRAQQTAPLRTAAEALATYSEGAFWLATLLDVCLEAPFVVLIPELQEAWELVLDGCVHLEQMMTLLSAALSRSLRRMGVEAPASDEALAIARGEGPQQCDSLYAARFALYAWQAMDGDSGRPVDGKFTWHAPGGSGDIWLPGDFRPSRVEPLRDRRVVVLVKTSMIRGIAAARMFPALTAGISGLRQLSQAEASRWTDPVAPGFFAPRR
jgi:hypothetical protein